MITAIIAIINDYGKNVGKGSEKARKSSAKGRKSSEKAWKKLGKSSEKADRK